MELIKSVKLEEEEEFSLEYYLRDAREYSIGNGISNYDLLVIKKIQNKIVDAAYNKLPYKNLGDAIKFVEKLSKNSVTPITVNELLIDDIYAIIN